MFIIVMIGVIVFYVIERYWLSERVEAAKPETIQKIEEKLLAVEDMGKITLHDLGERLHLTRDSIRIDEKDLPPIADEKEKKKPSDNQSPTTDD